LIVPRVQPVCYFTVFALVPLAEGLDFENVEITILGREISFGAGRIVFPRVEFKSTTKKLLKRLVSLPDNAPVKLQFIALEPGIVRVQQTGKRQSSSDQNKGKGQRKLTEELYDGILAAYAVGEYGEAALEDGENRLTVRNRLRAAASRRLHWDRIQTYSG
jgi:hypothetical protein